MSLGADMLLQFGRVQNGKDGAIGSKACPLGKKRIRSGRQKGCTCSLEARRGEFGRVAVKFREPAGFRGALGAFGSAPLGSQHNFGLFHE